MRYINDSLSILRRKQLTPLPRKHAIKFYCVLNKTYIFLTHTQLKVPVQRINRRARYVTKNKGEKNCHFNSYSRLTQEMRARNQTGCL